MLIIRILLMSALFVMVVINKRRFQSKRTTLFLITVLIVCIRTKRPRRERTRESYVGCDYGRRHYYYCVSCCVGGVLVTPASPPPGSPPPAQAPPSHNNKPPQRLTPLNELDLQLMVTNPKWGDWDIPDELKQQLGSGQWYRDPETGELFMSEKSLWGLLGYYTRDLRLGNLKTIGGEDEYCAAYLDFAGDCLQEGNPSSFLVALKRVITRLELSQSRGGFLRRRQGTLTTEKFESSLEPKKRGLFGNKQQGGPTQ